MTNLRADLESELKDEILVGRDLWVLEMLKSVTPQIFMKRYGFNLITDITLAKVLSSVTPVSLNASFGVFVF